MSILAWSPRLLSSKFRRPLSPQRTSPCCAIRLRLWIAPLRGLPSSAMSWASLTAPPCLRRRVRNKASLRRVCETRRARRVVTSSWSILS
jgi:hypothetical protein